MSSSNCCFLTCIQISQEADQVVWYSYLFQNFPQFLVIHTVKGFGIVNKAEIDVFLELSSFSMTRRMLAIWSLVPLPFLKPAWTSGSSRFTYCWSVSNSVRPHRRQPTRLPRPWDSPGKNTGVGCHLVCAIIFSLMEMLDSTVFYLQRLRGNLQINLKSPAWEDSRTSVCCVCVCVQGVEYLHSCFGRRHRSMRLWTIGH